MTLWFLRSRSTKYATRDAIAAAAVVLRQRMYAVRESSSTGGAQWQAARAAAGNYDSQFVSAVRSLPYPERRLVLAWERALVMSCWYAPGDRSGYGPLEDYGFRLVSALPYGVDPSMCREYVDAVDHRSEMGSRIDGEGELGDETSVVVSVVDQKELRRRMKDERELIVRDSAIGSESARIAQSLRHYVPWLDFACEYLQAPRAVDDLNELATRWRIEHSKYVVTSPDYANVRITGNDADARRDTQR